MVLIGQIMGWVSSLFTFFSYQCKGQKKLVFFQVLSATSICISYGFLGARSGMLLNVVCIARNLIIYKKDLKVFSYAFWPWLLAGIMAVAGAFSWQGPMSLLIIVALAVNTLFLYSSNVQRLRISILVTCTMVLIYNVYYTVWGGVLNESIAIVSSLIGLYRYRTKR